MGRLFQNILINAPDDVILDISPYRFKFKLKFNYRFIIMLIL